VGARWRTAGERYASGWQPVMVPEHARTQARMHGLPSSCGTGACSAPQQPGFPCSLQGCPHALQILGNGPALNNPGSAQEPHVRTQQRSGLGPAAPARPRGARPSARAARAHPRAQSMRSRKSMRAFIVFFIFSCSRSARCAIRISASVTCAAR